MSSETYTLIDAIHDAERINKGTWFAFANMRAHVLIADSLAELQVAAEAARADGNEVERRAHISLTDSEDQEQLSEQRGNC
jgi:Mn-dependent DtxR family transcriptional regulator